MEIQVLHEPDGAKGAFHHCLRGSPFIFGQEIPLKRTSVDPNTDGNPPLLGHSDDILYSLSSPDRPWVNPYGVRSPFHGFDGQSVVEVDIGHQGECNSLPDLAESFTGHLIWDGHPHDFTSGGLQALDLGNGLIYIPSVGLGHGLHRDGGIPSYLDPTYGYLPCPLSFHIADNTSGGKGTISHFPVIAWHSYQRGERNGELSSTPPPSHRGEYLDRQA